MTITPRQQMQRDQAENDSVELDERRHDVADLQSHHLKMEARLERRQARRFMALVVVLLIGIAVSAYLQDRAAAGRNDDQAVILDAITESQANVVLLLSRSSANTARSCGFAQATTELIVAIIDPADRTPAVETALEHLQEAVADGCDPADFVPDN